MTGKILILLTPALLCGACAQTGKANAPVMPEPAPQLGQGPCSIDGLKSLVGQKGTSELAVRALRMSGAKTIRWRKPGMAYTMDFRSDRLNIDLTADNQVTGFACN